MARWDIQPVDVRVRLHAPVRWLARSRDHLVVMQQAMEIAGRESSSDVVAAALAGVAQARHCDAQLVVSRLQAAFCWRGYRGGRVSAG